MSRHLIEELVFEIAFASDNQAIRTEAYLSELLTATLLPVVEQVLDEFDDGQAVLLLPSLELDLGDIDQADFEQQAAQRLRVALDDALQRALPAARQARGDLAIGAICTDGGGAGATLVSHQQSDLAQLAYFLDTGRLPWHADLASPRLHEQLLARLLQSGGDALWEVLARALSQPGSARRLVEQFPEHQLLALVRDAEPARAGQVDALLGLAAQWTDGAAWRQAVAERGARSAPRLQALEGLSHGAMIDLLAEFLDSGQLRIAPDSMAGLPAHEALLERLLAHGGDAIRIFLARAMADPASARRLVGQFPERQLWALLRCVNPERAAQAVPTSMSWQDVFADCMNEPDAGRANSVDTIFDEFLDSGRLAAPAGNPAAILARLVEHGGDTLLPLISRALTHSDRAQRALERLLAQGTDALWALVARAMADPASILRLVDLVSREHLQAVVQRVAPQRANRIAALLDELSLGANASAWQVVLADCLRHVAAGSAPDTGCTNLRTALSQLMKTPAVVFAQFLDSGALAGHDNMLARLLHQGGDALLPVVARALARAESAQRVLERLLTQGNDALWKLVARALADAASTRRLVELVPKEQLKAVVRRVAPQRAGPIAALLDELGLRESVNAWQLVLTDCMRHVAAGRVPDNVCTALRQALVQLLPTSGAVFARFLDSGKLAAADVGVSDIIGHEQMLARLLDKGGDVLLPVITQALARPDSAQRVLERLLAQTSVTLWSLMARALADPASTRRLVELVPERQLRALIRRIAPARAAQLEAVLEEVRRLASGPGAAVINAMAWQAVLADCINGGETGCARIRDLLAPFQRPDKSDAHPRQPAQPGADDALIAPVATALARAESAQRMLERMLTQGADALWSPLARALALPANARRMVELLPKHQLRALLRRVAPARAGHYEALLDQVSRDASGPDATALVSLAWQEVVADCMGRPGSGGAPDAVCLSIRQALARFERQNRVVDMPMDARHDKAPLSHRARLQRFAQFLDTGLLPRTVAAHSGEHNAQEALLDDVLENADDSVWRVIAYALEQSGSAGRLLTQFPKRQLLAICSRSAPAHAPALQRLLQRLSPLEAGVSGPNAGKRLQLVWGHLLSACVARPAVRAVPGVVYARIAIELDGLANAGVADRQCFAYTPAQPAPAEQAWRGNQRERGVSAALLRLSSLFEQLGPLPVAGASVGATGGAVVGTVLREREQMARWLRTECSVLEARAARPGDGPLETWADLADLRAVLEAQVGANPAIAVQRRPLLLGSIDEKAAQAADPARFLSSVIDALAKNAPLDLDELLARQADAGLPSPASALQLFTSALLAGDAAALFAHWRVLLRQHPARIRAGLRHYGRSPALRSALARSLPDAILIDLAGLLDAAAPAVLNALLDDSSPLPAVLGSPAAWTGWKERCRSHALATLVGDAAGSGAIDAGRFLREMARTAGHQEAALAAVLPAQFRQAASGVPQAVQPISRAVEAPMLTWGQPTATASPPLEPRECVLVANAGMVLAAPYLPRLFSSLGLTVEGKFIDEQAAARAVHLVQYMVNGKARSPEYQLVLNKILCGLPTAAPVPAGIDITEAEQQSIDGMIQAMVGHWKAIGNSSIAAMRQTFFTRNGDLQLIDDAWQLQVHPGTFDVLLDRLPWNYTIIKFGWMARPVHVEWRPTP